MTQPVSRREFFGQLSVSTAVSAATVAVSPPRAWIILERNWEHNDEFNYEEGASVLSQLFYEEATAEAECRRLCDAFFAEQTPAEFEVDWNCYDLPRGPDFDEDSVTWDELLAVGFPKPYYVKELTVPGDEPHE